MVKMLRRALPWVLLAGLLLTAAGAAASDEPAPPPESTPAAEASPAPESAPAAAAPPAPAEAPAPSPEKPTYYARTLQIADVMARENDRLLWGRAVERVPRTTIGFELDYAYQRLDARFDGAGRRDNALQEIDLHDPFGGRGSFLDLQADARVRLQTIKLQLSYGVTNNWVVFACLPLVRQDGYLIYHFTPGSSVRLGIRTLNDAFHLFREFGRPQPVQRYHDPGWTMGDAEAGAAWTYFDAPFVTLTAQFGVIAPTGQPANPNEAQRFGLGVQIDKGMGAVAPTVTQRVRVPFPKPLAWAGFTGEATLDYYLPAHRVAPGWGQPNPQAPEIRRALQLNNDDRFLDLSQAARNYTLTAGVDFTAMTALTFQFAYFSVGAGYVYEARQTPYVVADQLWKRYFRASDSYLASDSHAVSLQAGVPLLPLRLPGLLDLGYQFGVAGRNTPNFADRFLLQIMFALPLE